MKRTNLIKIITVALSCLLLIGAIVGISVSAANETAVSIKAKNLAYEGAIQVLYAVDAENVPEGGKLQMYFYDAKDAEAPAYVKDEYTDEDLVIGGVTYHAFFSKGIAPKNMRAPIFAKAVVVDAKGEVIAESEISEYSVFTYATNRFSKNPTEDQFLLYTAMLNYGAAVQNMLVKTTPMTEQDVIDNGGWANEYCGIREDIVIDGKTVVTGDVKFYTPDQIVDISVGNSYENGVFNSIKDEKGNVLTGRAYPKASVVTEKPGVSVYTANYDVTGYAFRTFDDLCIDGSENDVNILHKGKTGLEAQNAFGAHPMNGTFGNSATGTSAGYQRVAADKNGNKVYLVGSNGVAANNALSFTLDEYSIGAEKYVMQFDLNWHGRTDSVGDSPVFFRIDSKEMLDQYDLALLYVNDSGSSKTTYTFDGVTLNKNQLYTIRFELVPINGGYYDMYMYVDGKLAKSSLIVCPSDYSTAPNAPSTVRAFLGMRFFNRKATHYSYTIDNVYVGTEGEYVAGNGVHANNAATFKYNDGTSVSSYVYQGVPEDKYAKIENGVFNMGQEVLGLKNSGSLTGEKYVFETDFYVDTTAATATASNENLGWWGMNGVDSRSKDKQFASYTLNYQAENSKIKNVFIKRNDGATSTVQKLEPNTWYNIRIEYTPTTEYKGTVNFYVNDALITSYTANGYSNKGNITNAAFYGMGFEWRGGASAVSGIKYIYDNTYLSATNNPANGAYYNDAEKLGTRYDCASIDSITFGKNGSTESTTKYLSSANGILTIAPGTTGGVDSAFGIANKPIGDATALPTGNVHVFETDVRFAGGYADGAGDLNMGWIGMSSNSFDKGDSFVPLAIYGVKGENGIITSYQIRDHVSGGGKTVATLTAGEWYNLRFVYTADNTVDDAGNVTAYKGNVEVFVNNEKVYEYTTSGYSVSDSNQEPNEVFTQFSFQLRTRASSGIGWFKMEMDNIFLGTFTK